MDYACILNSSTKWRMHPTWPPRLRTCAWMRVLPWSAPPHIHWKRKIDGAIWTHRPLQQRWVTRNCHDTCCWNPCATTLPRHYHDLWQLSWFWSNESDILKAFFTKYIILSHKTVFFPSGSTENCRFGSPETLFQCRKKHHFWITLIFRVIEVRG